MTGAKRIPSCKIFMMKGKSYCHIVKYCFYLLLAFIFAPTMISQMRAVTVKEIQEDHYVSKKNSKWAGETFIGTQLSLQ